MICTPPPFPSQDKPDFINKEATKGQSTHGLGRWFQILKKVSRMIVIDLETY